MGYEPVVYFISIDYLKENTPIEPAVDNDKLSPWIIQSQTTYLMGLLGATFYDRLKSGVQNNNLNTDEEYLMRNYIQPMIAQYTFYLALPFLNFKITNLSVAKESGDNSTAVDLSEIKFLRNTVLDTAQFYASRLVKYLKDYDFKFPEYLNPDSKDNLPRKSKPYFTGLYMPTTKPNFNNVETYYEPVGKNYTRPC